MKAIVYDFSIGKYVAAKALGKQFPSFYYGKQSALSLKKISEPDLPGEKWLKVEPIYAGLCGTDMGAIFYKTSPALTPFNSFPAVLGHEAVGVVTEVGSKVKSVSVGDRITIDPYIGCEVRGRENLCESCRAGLICLCRYSGGTESFGPGMILGFCEQLPGTWSESFVIHESMAIPISDKISNDVAAIFEPLSVGLHAVLRKLPKQGDNVLVIGSGIIAFSVIVALELLNIECHITHVVRLPYQQDIGKKLGVNKSVIGPEQLKEAMLSLPETSVHKPVIGREVFTGGYDIIFDCAGNEESLNDSLRMVSERGSVVLVGCAGEMKNLDWTFIWANELSIIGTHAYSQKETWQDEVISTQQLLLKLLEQRSDCPVDLLITHKFPLNDYKEAIITNQDRRTYESIKVLFTI